MRGAFNKLRGTNIKTERKSRSEQPKSYQKGAPPADPPGSQLDSVVLFCFSAEPGKCTINRLAKQLLIFLVIYPPNEIGSVVNALRDSLREPTVVHHLVRFVELLVLACRFRVAVTKVVCME